MNVRTARVVFAAVAGCATSPVRSASSNLATFRGNISLMRGDTTGAIAAFREAVRRDSTNGEAQGRLRQLTRP